MSVRGAWLGVLLFAVTGVADAATPDATTMKGTHADPGVADAATPFVSTLKSRYADNEGVRIHYKTAGSGPLIVFVHGFPDFWYSWIHQLEGLSTDHQVAALDTRGYNRSDAPDGVANYAMPLLIGDVAAVIRNEGRTSAIIVGHDWGGAIAWNFAMSMPQMTKKLIIVNLPHPAGIARELATNKTQQANSQYARDFQKPDAHKSLSAEGLSRMLGRNNPAKTAVYAEAFGRSNFEGMLNYYKANYPRTTGEGDSAPAPLMPRVSVPVLQFHGLADTALHHYALNKTWDYLDADYTLVTLPGVGHWAHHEAASMVTDTMRWWLKMRAGTAD